MGETHALIKSLKQCLKVRGISYVDIAQSLSISESSVKRTFADETFTMERLEKICALLDMSIYDLTKMTFVRSECRPRVLDLNQEQALAQDENLFVCFHLVINGFCYEDILKSYDWSDARTIKLLTTLDKLKLIELLPENKIKVLTANIIQWQKNGPVRKMYEGTVREEFLKAPFVGKYSLMSFETMELSHASVTIIISKIEQLLKQIDELAEVDMGLPKKLKCGHGVLLAVRPWVFSIVKKHKQS